MPRFLFSYKFKRTCNNLPKNVFEKAENFFQSQTSEKTFIKHYNFFSGKVRIVSIIKKSEEDKVFFDKKTKSAVFLDGSPIKDHKELNAKEYWKQLNELGPQKLANQIDGTWSAIVVNSNIKSILVFRDRFGRAPFYFAQNNDTILASSSSGAIIKTGVISNNYNENIIARYASSNYMATFGQKNSFFKNVYLIDPASFLLINQNGEINRHHYWVPNTGASYFDYSDDIIEKKFTNCLLEMTKKYYEINKDQNFGVALSGGIDSGAIIGLLHKQHKKRIQSISMTYSEPTPFDETSLINCSVRDHVSEATDIKIDSKQLLEDLPNLYYHFDVPMPTITAYCHEILFKKTTDLNINVLFTGAGGDALQAGTYPFYLYNLADLKYSDPKNFEYELNCWIKNHHTEIHHKDRHTVENFFSKRIDFSRIGRFKSNEMFLENNILDADFKAKVGGLGQPIVDYPVDYLRSYIMQELWYDSNAAFESEDVMSWNYGLKIVSPFFDKKIIDFAWRLPSKYKIKDGVNKILARKVLRGIVPDEILDTVQKQGFNGPFDIWIKKNLREFVMDHLTSAKFKNRGIYNQVVFQKSLEEHMNSERNHMMLLWQALNLELWFINWIDKN